MPITLSDKETLEVIEALEYAVDQAKRRINLGSVYDLQSPETKNAMMLYSKYSRLLREIRGIK
jgi:hypothetical protein